ncbi:BTAD domain-containing putative transcriptional regulator [Pseudonocardia ailaonensis]|uniref:BTAD domain-containing putative transcriptional regulator n=1 Tax=Pseudonocardia ailaonensis TaxID=367279 RepID=A0ABN2N4E9_9PSEU
MLPPYPSPVPDLDIRLLGPVEIRRAGTALAVAPKQRTLLAALLTGGSRGVPPDELAEHLWAGRRPSDPRAAVHVHVARLRGILAPLGDRAQVVSGPAGYRLRLHPGVLDLDRVRAEEQRADAARAAGDLDTEIDAVRAALGEWRGEPLGGVAADDLRAAVVPALADRRLRLRDRRFDLELAAGRHEHLVGELRELCREHPLREGFWSRLMTALHRSGRRAEALAAFAEVRAVLAEELGIEPGDELSRLHREILIGIPDPTPVPDAWQSQCRLPPAPAALAGREVEIRRIRAALDSDGRCRVVALAGLPGVGKTALGLHAAHALRADFPDGQWYVRLHDEQGGTRPLTEAAGELLGASGVPVDAVPASLDARAGLLRARLAGRRVLIMIDDAADASQIWPLLPGTSGSAVLVATRADPTELMALHGARVVEVRPLTAGPAVRLLEEQAGSDRITAEPQAAAELWRWCAGMPRALRAAGADLATRPELTVEAYVRELDRPGTGAAPAGPAAAESIRAAHRIAVERLDRPARRLVRLLGACPLPELTETAAARLAGTGVAEVRPVLAALANAGLVLARPGGRFRMSGPVHGAAADQYLAGGSDPAAVRRLYDHYLGTVFAIALRWFPAVVRLELCDLVTALEVEPPPTEDAALDWLDREREQLLALITGAVGAGMAEHAWLLTDALRGYFLQHGHRETWQVAADAALRAADAAGATGPAAVMRYHLALLTRFGGDVAGAARQFDTAIGQFHDAGARDFEAAALSSAGILHLHRSYGRLADALPGLHRACAIATELGVATLRAQTLRDVGVLQHSMGDLRAALRSFTAGLRLVSAENAAHAEPELMIKKGLVLVDLGRPGEATTLFDRALGHPMTGRAQAATAHYGVAAAMGDDPRATDHIDHAQRLARDLYPVLIPLCLNLSAVTCARAGRFGVARDLWGRSLVVARELGQEQAELDALLGVAGLPGPVDTALRTARRATNTAGRRGFGLQELTGRRLLARLHREAGEPTAALAEAEAAAALVERTGARPETPPDGHLLEPCRAS